VFFFEEVADNSWLILSPPEVCSSVGHHVRLIAGPLPAHGLLVGIIRDGSGFAPLSSRASLLAVTTTQGTDYAVVGEATGTVTFAAGSATAAVTVDPTVDTSVEPDETVALSLAAGTGYTIGTTAAVVGTITNDDAATTPPPSLPSTPPPSNITALPGYGVATSSFFYFAAGGWAGWSVPAGKVVLGAKIISPGDSIDDFSVYKAAGPDEVYPHWTFGPAEHGWVMQAKQVNYGVQIELYYADPAVDLDVDSNNDGKIDPDNGAAGTDDRIEESTDDQGVIVRPGVIVPVGGDRAKMVVKGNWCQPRKMGKVRIHQIWWSATALPGPPRRARTTPSAAERPAALG